MKRGGAQAWIKHLEAQLARTAAALNAALEAFGEPSFIVGHDGAVLETNSAGRALMKKRRSVVHEELRNACARKPTTLPIEVTRVRATNGEACYVAVVRLASAEERTTANVARAATRLRLTPRQTQILELVAQGAATRTIANELGIGARTVELHMTAIFDKAGVDSRSALISMLVGM